jgi:hypothetical protein
MRSCPALLRIHKFASSSEEKNIGKNMGQSMPGETHLYLIGAVFDHFGVGKLLLLHSLVIA